MRNQRIQNIALSVLYSLSILSIVSNVESKQQYSSLLSEQPTETIRFEFSEKTAEENGITLMGAGFDAYPSALVFFSTIPTSGMFEEAADGHGAIVVAGPGQGVMIFGPIIDTTKTALIRCSVRSDGPNVSVTAAAIGQGQSVFVSTNSPTNGALFVDKYKRLSTFFIPPSTGFQPLIQVFNPSESEAVTVYLDNLEITLLDPNRFYSAQFLDGDETDPEIISILPSEEPTPIPTALPSDDPYEPDDTETQASVFSVYESQTYELTRAIDPEGDIDCMVFGFVTTGNMNSTQSRLQYGNTQWRFEILVESLTPGASIQFNPTDTLSENDLHDDSGGVFYGVGYPVLPFKISGEVCHYKIWMHATVVPESQETPVPTATAFPTHTPTVTMTPSNTQLPSSTEFPTSIPTAPPQNTPVIGEFQIADVTWNYSSPYLLDFNFTLRDIDGHPISADPSTLNFTCLEDGAPVSVTDTGARLSLASNKWLKCYLILDYTLGIADPNVNGDANRDGKSDAIESMERAAKQFVDEMSADALIGVYEFHRDEDPQQVNAFSNKKDFVKNNIDSIFSETIQWSFGDSRCWDAIQSAIEEFNGVGSRDERRMIVVLSDGRDVSSEAAPSDIISWANEKGIAVYCAGYGSALDPANLKAISEQTDGAYYQADTPQEIEDVYQRISEELNAQYTLRWITQKRDSTTFTPGFTISLDDHSDTFTGQEESFTPMDYSGDLSQGIVRIAASDGAHNKTTVFIRMEYAPRWIRKLRLHIESLYPFTADLLSNKAGEICDGWNLSQSVDEWGGHWIELESSNPANPFTAIPFGAFGPILKLEFSGVTDLDSILACGWFTDNSIYTDTGEQTITIYNTDSSNPIPTCVPTLTYTPTPTFTPTPWPAPEFRELVIDLPNLVDGAKFLELVWIPPGDFIMGSPEDERYREGDEIQHPVTITKPFYMGKYEVTQAQWRAVMGTNPSYFTGRLNHPVEQVSWEECQEFVRRLNQLNQGTFRAPTEAEWEYASRAGTISRYYWGTTGVQQKSVNSLGTKAIQNLLHTKWDLKIRMDMDYLI